LAAGAVLVLVLVLVLLLNLESVLGMDLGPWEDEMRGSFV